MVGVMCCGCMRVYLHDDQLSEPTGGLISMIRNPELLDVKIFADRSEADEYLRARGWEIENGNHRCPDCVLVGKGLASDMEELSAYLKTGAYIEV
jgi:hypothetical protein